MSKKDWLAERNRLTAQLRASHYDPAIYIDRAIAHENLGYHDLAAADAYKALLLTDEAQDEAEEHHEETKAALRGRLQDGRSGLDRTAVASCGCSDGASRDEPALDCECALQRLLKRLTVQCYAILSRSLLVVGCLRSALQYCNRGLAVDPHSAQLQSTRDAILEAGRAVLGTNHSPDIKDLPDDGHANRVLYPWNTHEPDRFSPASLAFLNSELAKIAPKCEAKVTELPTLSAPDASDLDRDGHPGPNRQLGLFAKEDIAPGEVFLYEISVVTATTLLHAPVCDACGITLPDDDDDDATPSPKPIPCSSCTDTIFCTAACAALAQRLYHPAICTDEASDSVARANTPPTEASEALYLLLLTRVLAMAVTQDLHPLELPQLKYTWGDFSPAPALAPAPALPSASASAPAPHRDRNPTTTTTTTTTTTRRMLPFSLVYNVVYPLQVLHQSFDLDIYASPLAEPWLFQTVYAKLRATASARLPPPPSSSSSSSTTDAAAAHVTTTTKSSSSTKTKAREITLPTPSGPVSLALLRSTPRPRAPIAAALHPLWALANHSCAPNVRWEWTAAATAADGAGGGAAPGGIRFIARDRGVRTGEEVLSHYCDVELDLWRRREWMVGCLGGWCVCERCLREEREERAESEEGEGGKGGGEGGEKS